MKVIRINVSEQEKAFIDLLRNVAENERIEALVAAQFPTLALALNAPVFPPIIKTWASKKDRAAGKGFPCTVAYPNDCGRTDLRTSETGVSHDSTQPKYHFPPKV